MSKLFRKAALLSAALVVMTTGWAFARPVEVLKIDIPFAFHAGDAKLPAGTYVVAKLDENEPTAIALRSADSEIQVDLLTESRQMYQTPRRTELQFLDFAGDHFLSQVSLKDQKMGWELQKSRAERALEMKGEKSKVVVIHTR